MESEWFLINENTKTFVSMKKATNLQEAFDKSIEKWELIKNKFVIDRACPLLMEVDACGLCDLYYAGEIICKGCPIREETSRPFCGGTLLYHDPEGEFQFLKELKEKWVLKSKQEHE